ncbi:16S rRNA (guanine(527)-N(7))-methyltransferase RsmG [Salisediminibacterium beveridgei]|uniref:Ribosomal RNA small subunit methyltransferase G n=1 Tax=Salisediminibacterium beveridgei TaxID=632773 RepID=A0A1D7QQX9_9BACI|nr:16S rRNA (guanine(527)-N(7))-methyltransferase RsmG [Salisediminibacterium beveridgei]AOM81413.1 rRNA small subunit methyltransferase, glucose inhibited division protein GidB [Salisediminibacterium beveridgei]
MTEKEFRQALAEKGIQLNDEQMDQFKTYYELLIEWNNRMNLTAITDKEDVYLKHFYDSISAAFHVDFNQASSLIDIGAGAGFPSIPLKIVFPHVEVTIVDSLKKRITFLEALGDALKLDRVLFLHDRAETAGRNPELRDQFDIAISRAVARMPVLTELCMPFVKQGGQFIAMKGMQGEDELKEAGRAVQALGGAPSSSYAFSLPGDDSERIIIVTHKEKKTPRKYPRKPGTPNKQPLS